MSTVNRWLLGAAIALSVLLGTTVGPWARQADAAIICGDTTWNVDNFTDLVSVIACFNGKTTAGVYTLNLDADITYSGIMPLITNTSTGVSLTIDGQGNALDANNSSRVIGVSGATVDIVDLTITGGNLNVGAGVHNSSGTVTITRSTISDNFVTFNGAAVYNLSGTVTIVDTTMSGNTATLRGGGLYNLAGSVTITNSTMSDNTADLGGGIYNFSGTLDAAFVTITDNTARHGGGVHSQNSASADTNVEASIISGNTSTDHTSGDVHLLANTGTNSFNSGGYNIIGTGNSLAVGAFNQTGDLTGQDPMLDTLAANGGPTLTHLPQFGSPAVDNVTAAPADDQTTDQRGEPRASLPKDAGAVEVVVPVLCNGLPVTVDLGAGDSPTAGDDVILGTAGADVIDGLAGNDTICGAGGNDDIRGNLGNDIIFGEGGDDQLRGREGDDVIFGGLGADFILGNDGADIINGEQGADVIFGGSGDDLIDGGPGNDRVGGSGDNDTLFGGDGNDNVAGGSGVDSISGGADDDTINAGTGDDIDVRGNGGSDTMSGNGGNDIVNGDGGNDIVRGGNGDDVVNGNAGDDQLFGNPGTDTCDGGAGIDTANVGNCETILNVP